MARRDYVNFDLELAAEDDGSFVARVLDSPAGEASAPFELPFSDEGLENFVLKVGRTRSGVRRFGSPQMEMAKTFGAELYDAAMTGEVRTTFRRAIDAAARDGLGLRVRLRVTGPGRLTSVPWEYMYSHGLSRFIVLSAETPMVRYIDLPNRPVPLAVDGPLRILMVVSSPTDVEPLDNEREVALLRDAVRDLIEQGLIEIDLLETATLHALQRKLRTDVYHVLHFIGHGGFDERTTDGLLVFESAEERANPVSGHDLGMLLHDHDSLRLVVLNACEGSRTSPDDPFSGVAQSLVKQGMPAVVGMQFEITDTAAITFSYELYTALVDGYPVDAATAEARKAIFASGNDVEWGTPVLHMRTTDGVIFDTSHMAPHLPVERAAIPEVEETPTETVVAPSPILPDAAPDELLQESNPPLAEPVAVAPASEPEPPPVETHTGPEGASPEPTASPEPSSDVSVPPPPERRDEGTPNGETARRPSTGVLVGGAVGVIALLVLLFTAFGGDDDPGAEVLPTVVEGEASQEADESGAGAGGITQATGVEAHQSAPIIGPGDTLRAVQILSPPSVDGLILEDWPRGWVAFAQDFVGGSAGGAVDVSGDVQLGWDAGSLYLGAIVTDPEVRQPHETRPDQLWRGDSVSFEFGVADGTGPARQGDLHVMFGPVPGASDSCVVINAINPNDGSSFESGSPDPRMEAACLVDADDQGVFGYRVEAVIPWSVLGVSDPEVGDRFLVNVNISDVGADGNLSAMVSTNPDRNQPDRTTWQELELGGPQP